MYTKVQIINLGLGKISSSLISRIDPPQSSLERFCAAGYENWKRTEIAKRRWVFATDDEVALPMIEERDGSEFRYVYQLPTDCLRPIRLKRDTWRQRRRTIQAHDQNLRVSLIMNVPESELDPLFIEVLACRIAMECVEYVTQSNTKMEAASVMYDRAVTDASRSNSFVIGPENITNDDSAYPFVHERF